jgi:hypothetical protein
VIRGSQRSEPIRGACALRAHPSGSPKRMLVLLVQNGCGSSSLRAEYHRKSGDRGRPARADRCIQREVQDIGAEYSRVTESLETDAGSVLGLTQAGPDCVHQSGSLVACRRATPIQRIWVQRDKERVTEAECAPRVLTLGVCCDAPERARGRASA